MQDAGARAYLLSLDDGRLALAALELCRLLITTVNMHTITRSIAKKFNKQLVSLQ